VLRQFLRRFGAEDGGAISSLYAIAILPLVVMTGVAFDYGRMMGLDTELQNAADQAALAAATQLDGSAAAITNSQIAAADALGNQTRFSNDPIGRPIPSQAVGGLGGLTFAYYEGYLDDAPVGETDVPEDARVVEVTVENRGLIYALTPVMAAFRGDVARGRAMATMQAATCNVPPMMFCVPNDASGNADVNFPRTSDIGKALKLHMNANQADPWAPGNFGFLDIDYETSSTGNPNHTLGLNADFLGCTGEVIESRTGVRDPEADALNSRMDYYSGSVNKNSCNPATGDKCPAANVRKDFALTPPGNQTCSSYNPTGNANWVATPQVKSLPEDSCMTSGGCNVVGDGLWARNEYFAQRNTSNASYEIPSASAFGKASMSDVTRYDVYKWELKDPANRMKVEEFNVSGERRCSYPQPVFGTAIPSSDTQKDRRLLTVAAVDCTGLHGSQPVRILRWVDLFLIQPANISGPDKAFTTEIVGPARLAGDRSAFQNYSRKKAVLLR
jgi:Flp pilus assembly protein TadG